jgi:hypothetical protein
VTSKAINLSVAIFIVCCLAVAIGGTLWLTGMAWIVAVQAMI